MNGPQASLLGDGRLHLNHGPIDLLVDARGAEAQVRAARAAATRRFRTVLDELVAELPALRRAAGAVPRAFAGPVARRMEAAVVPLATGGTFITPMAAVAGSVADEILAAMVAAAPLSRASVNNGGDIAIHLAPGEAMSVAIAGTGHGFADRIAIRAGQPVRGIATSGWRGRSFSLGIADAATVLAQTAAQADAAATIIANAVDLPGHPAVRRAPAESLQPDSDLGKRLVTVAVGPLTKDDIAAALDDGRAAAEMLRQQGLVEAAALFLRGATRVCAVAPSTMLRMVPLPRFAGEDLALRAASPWILPRARGGGTMQRPAE